MKILIVTEGYFPGEKYGGPPVSVDNFCTLMTECKCFVITKDHDKDEKNKYSNIKMGEWNDRGNCNVKYMSDTEYNKKNFENAIIDIKPDIIYLQSLFQGCIVSCLQLALKYKIKVILAPRGELCSGAFKKKYKKIPYIILLKKFGLLKNVYYQSTSDEETEAIIRILRVELKKIKQLSNIPSIPLEEYVHKKKKSNSGRFIFLSRIHPKKNLLTAIKCLKTVKGECILDVYGPLEDKLYWEECMRNIEILPENVKVRYMGMINHTEVHKKFSEYDAFLFPTFSENYGHVIAEALFSGTVVITSDQTPWIDLEINNVGWAIGLDEERKITKAVQTIIDMDNNEYSLMSENAKKYVYKKTNLESLKKEYQELLEIEV